MASTPRISTVTAIVRNYKKALNILGKIQTQTADGLAQRKEELELSKIYANLLNKRAQSLIKNTEGFLLFTTAVRTVRTLRFAMDPVARTTLIMCIEPITDSYLFWKRELLQLVKSL